MTTFKSVEEAYKSKAKGMAVYAQRKLYRPEDKEDVVNDAFVKALEYHKKNPKALISSFILDRELDRAIRRANKTSKELPTDFTLTTDITTDTKDDELYT